MIEKDPKARVWAIPAPGGGSRAFCDRMNGWAQKEGQPGLGYIFWRERATEQRLAPVPIAKNLGPERATADRRSSLALKVGDARVLRRRQPGEVLQVRRRCAHADRHGAEARQGGPVRAGLDRRLPVLRVERGGEEDRLLAQPVLDAAGRPGGAGGCREAGPTRSYSRSRPTSTTSSATASRSPRAASATTSRTPWSRRSASPGCAPRGGGSALRRHVPRLPVRRAAARRHGGRHRPHGHAAGRAPRTCARWRCSP